MDRLALFGPPSPNMDFLSRDLAEYLSRNLQTPVQLMIDLPSLPRSWLEAAIWIAPPIIPM